MNIRTLTFRLLLILLAVSIAGASIYPPERSFRLGKDLSGGVSLTYAVQLSPEDDAAAVMDALKEVLKKRVDPENQLDIGIVKQGRDRLEITMPLPSQRVKNLRAEFDAALERLDEAALSEQEFDALMRAPSEEREPQIVRIAAGPEGAEHLRKAAAALDRARASRGALRAAQAEGAPAERLNELVSATAEAEAEYEDLRATVLADSLSGADVGEALTLSRYPVRKVDQSTGQVVELPGPRVKALNRLREAHPGAAPLIEGAVAVFERYEAERKSLDDPEDLKRLLRGSGVLDFRITVKPQAHPEEARLRAEVAQVGPRNVKAADAGWYKINKIENWFNDVRDGEALVANPTGYFAARGYVVEEYNGEYHMLCWDVSGSRLVHEPGSNWTVSAARRGQDELGRPAIDFEMNPEGAVLLGQLTGAHVKENMAVLMDDQIYTAPVLNDRISRRGQISGEFSQEELNYIIRTLAAGSLAAKLSPEPMSEVVLAPDLGLDNLRKALRAGLVSLAICAVFLVGYYFSCGAIAVTGLLINAVLLVGVMALNEWAFTLPGIAGVILTFAMAVDANVLVYERMREEITRGEDLRTAVRLGYQRALSAIVDGNLTNLIVCVVLIRVGTQEVKGFAITMSVGVLTTLFSQLFVTRVIFGWLVEVLGWSRARMLPLVVPAVQRAFMVKVDWMRLRPVFYALSAGLMLLAASMVALRGTEMFDTEFRGGTSVTLQLKEAAPGQTMTLTRQEVQDRLNEIVGDTDDPKLRQLRNATIRVINPEADGVSSHKFEIKTLLTDKDLAEREIGRAFVDVIDAQPEVTFARSDAPAGRDTPTHPLTDAALGANIDRPLVRTGVQDFLGGVAIVLEGITPPVSRASLEQRLEKVRAEPHPDLPDVSGRRASVVVLEGDDATVRAAAVLVADPDVSFFTSSSAWEAMRDAEWKLLTRALTQETRLMSVQSFSPEIARTFVAQAVVALVLSTVLIVIYVWVRFNSVRYSVAAIVPTLHDCVATLGLIALAEILYDTQPDAAASLGLMPFKIDLTVVAAILTVLGYSINDKIVVLDRIRENRGKLTYASKKVINDSINQTMSRTIMTGTTTILSTFVLYLIGGEAVRAFSYSLGLGIVIGTFSSVSLGAPMVWARRLDRATP